MRLPRSQTCDHLRKQPVATRRVNQIAASAVKKPELGAPPPPLPAPDDDGAPELLLEDDDELDDELELLEELDEEDDELELEELLDPEEELEELLELEAAGIWTTALSLWTEPPGFETTTT